MKFIDNSELLLSTDDTSVKRILEILKVMYINFCILIFFIFIITITIKLYLIINNSTI